MYQSISVLGPVEGVKQVENQVNYLDKKVEAMQADIEGLGSDFRRLDIEMFQSVISFIKESMILILTKN